MLCRSTLTAAAWPGGCSRFHARVATYVPRFEFGPGRRVGEGRRAPRRGLPDGNRTFSARLPLSIASFWSSWTQLCTKIRANALRSGPPSQQSNSSQIRSTHLAAVLSKLATYGSGRGSADFPPSERTDSAPRHAYRKLQVDSLSIM